MTLLTLLFGDWHRHAYIPARLGWGDRPFELSDLGRGHHHWRVSAGHGSQYFSSAAG